jgi:uncharacterized protein
MKKRNILLLIFLFSCQITFAQKQNKKFKAIAFYTNRNDRAHISFVKEANVWFPKMAKKHHFEYDTTSNWANMNDDFLRKYQLVLFFDTRPEEASQRLAFERFMKNGGAWIGFHFAAFALNNSDFPQNWDWYHNEFLGVGQYKSNTWRPVSAILQVEDAKSPFTKKIPVTFKSAPNEWYRWERNIRENKDIEVILSVHPSSFPLGTGPKVHEIWNDGDYPIAWTNKNYRMLYMNMGHNDIDYEQKTYKELSHQFDNKTQNQFILNAVLELGKILKYSKKH